VLDAVRRCWASLWTDRAVSYRATNRIDHHVVRLAVVVQRMVDSHIAGVLFTANPVTGRRREAVIDASPGLGEAVVSGAVNPDHFVVDTVSGEIRERRLGDKRLVIRSLPGGGTEQVEQASGSDDACVTDEQIAALAALGERVETHYGSPQDTEWAIDADGALWLTQARPITTLYPLPDGAGAADPRVFFCFSLAQGLHRPITPSGMAGFRLLASAVSEMFGFPVADRRGGPKAYKEAGQRLYFDLTTVLRSTVGRQIVPRAFDVMEARSAVVMRSLFDLPWLSVIHKSRWPFVRRALRIALRFGVPGRAAQAIARPEAAQRRVDDMVERQVLGFALPDNATPAQRLDHAERILSEATVPVLPTILPVAVVGFGMLALAGKAVGKDIEEGDLQTVLRGLPHNVTTEMDLELWHLAARIRDAADAAEVFGEPAAELARRYWDGRLPEVAQQGLTDFLHRYGHRAVAEIDLGLPRWSDDPTHVLGVLSNYLRLTDTALSPDAQFARGAAEAEAMVDKLVAKARKRSRLHGRFVRFALKRARLLAGVREMPKYYLIVSLAEVRKQVAEVGAALAADGRLESADDVFFLDFAEMRSTDGDLDAIVADRREEYEREMHRRHIPRVLLSDGTEPEAASGPVAEGALTGTPASRGTVTGRARVVLDPVGAHLEPGEILVAPSTDPGWTPLFLTAGGLVMEMGGANSHGAVVAREYGIPAVVGVADAVSRITTGQLVTVDGALGTVTPVDQD
jgi:pyruvate,water dikinase